MSRPTTTRLSKAASGAATDSMAARPRGPAGRRSADRKPSVQAAEAVLASAISQAALETRWPWRCTAPRPATMKAKAVDASTAQLFFPWAPLPRAGDQSPPPGAARCQKAKHQ